MVDSVGDSQAVYLPSPYNTVSYNIGCHSVIFDPAWPINVSHEQDHNPKSQHRDFAAAVAAEGKCRADIDEFANLFSRQNLEWGTGFVC